MRLNINVLDTDVEAYLRQFNKFERALVIKQWLRDCVRGKRGYSLDNTQISVLAEGKFQSQVHDKLLIAPEKKPAIILTGAAGAKIELDDDIFGDFK